MLDTHSLLTPCLSLSINSFFFLLSLSLTTYATPFSPHQYFSLSSSFIGYLRHAFFFPSFFFLSLSSIAFFPPIPLFSFFFYCLPHFSLFHCPPVALFHCLRTHLLALVCVAVCCSVLQYVAVLQFVALCCGVLRCVAVCCDIFQ